MTILLADFNSVGRAANSSNKLSIGGEPVGAIFGFIKSMRRLLELHSDAKIICLNDGRAQWRFDLFPLYKGNRADTPEKIRDREIYKAQVPAIQEVLTYLGIDQITDSTAEADDLAGFFSQTLSGKNKIILATGDCDWKQLVTDKVIWMDHRTDSICTLKNFKESTGFNTPRQFLEAKAFIGDTSDNVPGVGGIGEGAALKIMEEFGSTAAFLRNMIDAVKAGKKIPKAYENFVKNIPPKDSSKYGKMLPPRDAFVRNMKLMDLSKYEPNKANLEIKRGSFNPKAFMEFCQDRLFKSITTDFTNWVSIFNR